jgi:CheY-like chemotaxis protein
MLFPKNILIVDDDPEDRDFLAEAIQRISPETRSHWASSGNEALRTLIDIYPLPDYIFMDLNMHGLNGKECLAEIKNNVRTRHIQVIIFTTSHMEEDIQMTRKLGASYFLVKPNNFNDLCQAIVRIMTHSPIPNHELRQVLHELY